MKKFINAIILGVAVLALSACSPSTVSESTEFVMPEGIAVPDNLNGEMTLPETSKYTIPENAETGENGGPGAMETTAVDYSYYPDDKQPVEVETEGTQITVYKPTRNGIVSDFSYVDTIDADSVIMAMINCNALTDDIEVTSFEIAEDGLSAVLEVTGCTAVYAAASDEVVVTAIANTFIDNFGLVEIDVIVDGEDYGYRGDSQEYDVKKTVKKK